MKKWYWLHRHRIRQGLSLSPNLDAERTEPVKATTRKAAVRQDSPRGEVRNVTTLK